MICTMVPLPLACLSLDFRCLHGVDGELSDIGGALDSIANGCWLKNNLWHCS